MIGRNELCPCGSGIKFKKCCKNKQTPTQHFSYNEQLLQIIETFFQEYPQNKEATSFSKQLEKWKKYLSPYFNDDIIYALVQNDYTFHQKPDIWTSYCKQIRKKSTHPYIRNVLKKWTNARFIVGKVMNLSNGYAEMIDVFTNKTIYIYTNEKVTKDSFIITVILHDGSSKKTSYVPTCPIITLPANIYTPVEEMMVQFHLSKQTSQSFWKQQHLPFWRRIIEEIQLHDQEKTIESGILVETKAFLQHHNRDYTPLMDILSTYLIEQQPTARKEEAIIAGAIRFGQEKELFESLSMTVKEIAERFGVSPSSLNKYYQDLSSFAQMKYAHLQNS